MRKNSLMVFVGANILIAILVGMAYQKVTSPSTVGMLSMVQTTPTAEPTPEPTPEPEYNLNPEVKTDHWVSWALLDGDGDTFAGSENWDQPQYMMSMIKPWIAADYFNQHPNPSASVQARLSTMIIDSDNEIARAYFGGQPSWDRLVSYCGLTDFKPKSWSWSTSEMSARDAARYGDCIRSGKAAGATWTPWILDKMKNVRGMGDFGPRALFADRTTVATKNGWEPYEGQWYINCMATTSNWTIAILQRWPDTGQGYAKAIQEAEPVCNSIASQVLKLS